MARTYQTANDIEIVGDAILAYINRPVDRIVHRRRELQYITGGNQPRDSRPTPARVAISAMSEVSANRLRRYIDNYYTDFEGMVTLTYGEDYPKDGRVVKRHLNAFFESLRRICWFEEFSLVWWLEFQARGAPHVHMLITGWLSKSWVASTWSRISGAPCESCSRVEQLRDKESAGSYASKYASKKEQKEVPLGFENVGRFWGARGRRPAAGPRVPKAVAAATPAATRNILRACACAYTRARARAKFGSAVYTIGGIEFKRLRIYEHEGGWSCYGTANEIADLMWLINQCESQYKRDKGNDRQNR